MTASSQNLFLDFEHLKPTFVVMNPCYGCLRLRSPTRFDWCRGGGVKGAWSVTITNPEELEVRSWKFEIALHCTQKEATSALS